MRKNRASVLVVLLFFALLIASLRLAVEGSTLSDGKIHCLISTPIPVQSIGRPWHHSPREQASTLALFPEGIRPPQRKTFRCSQGENLSAVNVYLSNDFSAEDAMCIVGGVQNSGLSTQYNVVMQFFLGSPENGGTQIGADVEITSIPSGSTVYDSVSWCGFAGQSQIYCIVDPHQVLAEENEGDNTDSLMVGMVDDVPWVWQEVNGYCHYASQSMLFNFHGAGNTVYETLELACCPHSVAYQDDWLALSSGWYLSQGIVDIEFAGQIRNLGTDLVIKPSWTSYLSELRRRIDLGMPCETSVDPFWLPQPDYELLRTYGLHSGHGVVVVGYTDDAIIINDPGVGLDFLGEPAIPHPENRGANVILPEATFRNAVEWTAGSRYLLLSYAPVGPMPSHDQMLDRALDRSILRLGGDAGTFEPVLWQVFDIYGRNCFPYLQADATVETFQVVFNDVMSQTGGHLLDALNILAASFDIWGCGICWDAAAVFYGTQAYPQASKLRAFSQQLSSAEDEISEQFTDLLEVLYSSGGNVSLAGPYLAGMRSGLEAIAPLEDSVMAQLVSLGDQLTAVEVDGIAHGQMPRLELACYPNPFNRRTTISYRLSEDADVHLWIHNILGQRVCVLDRGCRRTGSHQVPWDGRDERGQDVSSGLYFCRLETEGVGQMVKMALMR